jgi:NADH-quinone oxidoreductase subunit E
MTRIPIHGTPGFRPPDAAPGPHEPTVLVGELRQTAEAIVARYPNSRSAALPLLFLVQSKEGYVTEEGMRDIADILGLTPADVLSTASFYTMLKKRPQGEYLISVCRNISCTHLGARKIIAELEEHLGIQAGETTSDGKITLEAAECLATCDGAPSMQINYEDFYRIDPEQVVMLVEKLRRGDPVFSTRREIVRTSKEIARETATAGLRSPGTAGDQVQDTFGGESMKGEEGPGFRPKELGGR